MSDALLVSQDERVAILTLNRPEKRNALNLDLSQALVSALNEAATNPAVGAILIAAQGKAFCAGMDLSEIGHVGSAEIDRVQEQLFTAGARITKPIVAAIHGPALAGGTGLVANAHIAIADPGASFGLTEIRIGLWPLLVFRAVALAVGERRAVEMSLTGRIVSAQDAREVGLIHELSETSYDRALSIARQLATSSLFAIRQGLEYVNQARGRTLQEAGELARQARLRVMENPDFARALAAFQTKHNRPDAFATHDIGVSNLSDTTQRS